MSIYDLPAQLDRIAAIREAAGWEFDPEYGWGSPEGITASDWENHYGYPLPEDPAFPAFISA